MEWTIRGSRVSRVGLVDLGERSVQRRETSGERTCMQNAKFCEIRSWVGRFPADA